MLKETNIAINIKTYMIKADGHWKVDYDRTMSQLVLKKEITELLDDIEELADTIKVGLSESAEQIKEQTIPKL